MNTSLYLSLAHLINNVINRLKLESLLNLCKAKLKYSSLGVIQKFSK